MGIVYHTGLNVLLPDLQMVLKWDVERRKSAAIGRRHNASHSGAQADVLNVTCGLLLISL